MTDIIAGITTLIVLAYIMNFAMRDAILENYESVWLYILPIRGIIAIISLLFIIGIMTIFFTWPLLIYYGVDFILKWL